MDDNIPIIGRNKASGPPINWDVVKTLENLLLDAKSGRLQGIVVVGAAVNDDSTRVAVGNMNWTTIGLLASMQISLAHQMHEVEQHMVRQQQAGAAAGSKLQ